MSRPLAGSQPPPALAERASPPPGPTPTPEPDRRRRARTLALCGALLAALAAVLIALLVSRSSPRATGSGGVPAGDTTAAVERRTLTEHAQLDGTLGYGAAVELYDRVSGTFTWLPGVGSVIARGGTLWRVNNLPVALMYGSVPAYRSLKAGVSDGPDVAQLNANLIALGFDPYRAIGDYAHFGAATAAAVRRWQAADALAQTGEVELGRVVFAPSARRVTAVHVSLGQDPPGASSPQAPASTPAASTHPASHPTHRHPSRRQPRRASATPRKSSSPHKSHPSASSPNGSPQGSKSKEPQPSGSANKEGSGSGAAMLVLSTTSTQQIVQLQVKATQQQLARVGESAPVTLPDGRSVRGKITGVGTVASESSEAEKGAGNGRGGENSGSGENATIPVTLVLQRPVARLDKAPVSVELVKETRSNVLAVPATALIATGGGGYAIQALIGGRRATLPVTPGMFANGYVQVEGAGVSDGLTVLEPQ